MNWVFDSMRKSLKTLWRRQSAAFVSLISPSTCFLISCVLEMVCCENSCKKRSSCRGQGKAALGAAPSAPQRHSRLRSRPHCHAHAWPRPRPRCSPRHPRPRTSSGCPYGSPPATRAAPTPPPAPPRPAPRSSSAGEGP